MADRRFHEFGCGHAIPMEVYRQARVQPWCTLCEKPRQPSQEKVIMLPLLPGMRLADPFDAQVQAVAQDVQEHGRGWLRVKAGPEGFTVERIPPAEVYRHG